MNQAIKILFVFFCCIGIASGNECGRKKIKKSKNLIQGEGTVDSYHGQWPWLVSLFRLEKRSEKFFCGASIINKWTLISAAHCFEFSPRVKALLGRHDFNNNSEVDWIERRIELIIKHPDYVDIMVVHEDTKKARSDADIAVLIMTEAVTFTDYILPICLPSSTVNAFKVDGVVAGHGIIDIVTRTTSSIPKQVAMSTVSLVECFSSKIDSSITVSKRSFCAKGNQSSPCEGDSGGGFYTKEKRSSRWTLLGIVSHLMNDQCDYQDFTSFTRIPLFMDFIINNAKGDVDFPDYYECDNATRRIAFRLKCDRKLDCTDGSDEDNCIAGSTSNSQTTFTVSKTNKVTNSECTIAAQRNEKIERFEIIDNRAVMYLPVRMGEIFPNLNDYEVQWCGIKKIIRENFALLYRLKVVNLKKNWIESVEGDAFQELTDLEELYLSTNQILILPDDIFKSNINLKKLSLRENEISSLSNKLFKNLLKLEFIDLNHNKLTDLTTEIFLENKAIKQIRLMGNKLKKIETNTFDDMKDLTNVDLRCNTCYSDNFNNLNEASEREKLQHVLVKGCETKKC